MTDLRGSIAMYESGDQAECFHNFLDACSILRKNGFTPTTLAETLGVFPIRGAGDERFFRPGAEQMCLRYICDTGAYITKDGMYIIDHPKLIPRPNIRPKECREKNERYCPLSPQEVELLKEINLGGIKKHGIKYSPDRRIRYFQRPKVPHLDAQLPLDKAMLAFFGEEEHVQRCKSFENIEFDLPEEHELEYIDDSGRPRDLNYYQFGLRFLHSRSVYPPFRVDYTIEISADREINSTLCEVLGLKKGKSNN